MIAGWMLYGALGAAMFAAAASVAERIVAAGRGPRRAAWASALILSVALPIVAFCMAWASGGQPRIAATPFQRIVNAVPGLAAIKWEAATNSRGADNIDNLLGAVWVASTVVAATYFVAGILLLRRRRRQWRRTVVLGVPVLVSPRSGPALMGMISPTIVIPEWILTLDSGRLRLLLRHEEEHRGAGDGRLTIAALLATLVMPWNPLIWWQVRRLRLAVEMDCDARVLRSADARSYVELLIEVARPRRTEPLFCATALVERRTQLERRISAIAGRPSGAVRGMRASATAIGLGAMAAAWMIPRPPLPLRSSTPAPTSAGALDLTVATMGRPAPTPATALNLADAVFRRLLSGIALSADQEARARAAIAKGMQPSLSQAALVIGTNSSAVRSILPPGGGPVLMDSPVDSALLAAIDDEADRAVVAARLAGAAKRENLGSHLGRRD